MHRKFIEPNGHAPEAEQFTESDHRYFHVHQALYSLEESIQHIGKLVHHAKGESVHRDFAEARRHVLEAMTRLSKVESALSEPEGDSKGGEAIE